MQRDAALQRAAFKAAIHSICVCDQTEGEACRRCDGQAAEDREFAAARRNRHWARGGRA